MSTISDNTFDHDFDVVVTKDLFLRYMKIRPLSRVLLRINPRSVLLSLNRGLRSTVWLVLMVSLKSEQSGVPFG